MSVSKESHGLVAGQKGQAELWGPWREGDTRKENGVCCHALEREELSSQPCEVLEGAGTCGHFSRQVVRDVWQGLDGTNH